MDQQTRLQRSSDWKVTNFICNHCRNKWSKVHPPNISPFDKQILCPKCGEEFVGCPNPWGTDAFNYDKIPGSGTVEYEYQARNTIGKLVKGSVKANDQQAAVSELTKLGLIVISLEARNHLKRVHALAILVTCAVLILVVFLQLAKQQGN